MRPDPIEIAFGDQKFTISALTIAQIRKIEKAIAAGEKVDYSSASGPCDFDDKGDILDCKFRYEQIKAGKPVLVKIA